MANGTRGDHPLTDILIHKVATFSPAIDRLICEIAALSGRKELEQRFDFFHLPPLEVFEQELRTLRDQRKQDAKERGWEIS